MDWEATPLRNTQNVSPQQEQHISPLSATFHQLLNGDIEGPKNLKRKNSEGSTASVKQDLDGDDEADDDDAEARMTSKDTRPHALHIPAEDTAGTWKISHPCWEGTHTHVSSLLRLLYAPRSHKPTFLPDLRNIPSLPPTDEEA